MKLDEVLKMKKASGDVKGFLNAVDAGTKSNPFQPRMRVYKESIGIEISEMWGMAHISSIMSFVKKNDGQASAALKWLTDLADKYEVTMHLGVKPIPNAGALEGKNLTKAQLTKWYAKNGFVKTRGDDMERAPIPKE